MTLSEAADSLRPSPPSPTPSSPTGPGVQRTAGQSSDRSGDGVPGLLAATVGQGYLVDAPADAASSRATQV